MGALYAVTVAVGLAVWPWLVHRFGKECVAAAGAIGMAAVAVGLALLLPVLAYVAIWPAVVGAGEPALSFAIARPYRAWLRLAILVLAAVPATGLLVAVLYGIDKLSAGAGRKQLTTT